MLKNKRIDPRDPETIEWGEQISETKTCVEFEELPGRYGIRTSQIFNDAEIDVFVGEYETSLDRITSGNPSETEFYASGGMAYIIVNAAHVGQDIRADYYPGGSVLTAEVLDSEDFKGPQGDTGPQGPTGPAGAPGDVSDVENVGAGVGVFKEIATGTARFKSLAAGANIDLDTTDPDEIEIAVDSGSLVGDAITDASAATLADADEFGFWQVVGAGLRKITWANIKATLKTYFDTLYSPIAVTNALRNVARVEKTTHTQYNTTIPLDNTIPQNTEGSEIFTVSITPTSAANYIRVRAVVNFSQDVVAANVITAALFVDSTANAVAASNHYPSTINNWDGQIVLDYRVLAGSTTARTYKLRMGSSTGNNFTVCGRIGAGIYGGVNISSMTVNEEPA